MSKRKFIEVSEDLEEEEDSATNMTDDPIKTAKADLASLSRVSHRLAMVDSSSKLSAVLEKLLPRLLKRLGDNHRLQQQLSTATSNSPLQELYQKIHVKLVEMISHTMKRVREDSFCRLPCQGIVDLMLLDKDPPDSAQSPESSLHNCSALTVNLSLPFLTIGISRLQDSELSNLLPALLVLLTSSRSRQLISSVHANQHYQIAHLLLTIVELLVAQQQQQQTQYLTMARDLVANQESSVGAAAFDLFLDALLYQPTSSNIPPSGMSQSGKDRLESNKDRASVIRNQRTGLAKFKLAILELIAPTRSWNLLFSVSTKENQARTMALLIVATGDTAMEVSERASLYLKLHLDKNTSGEIIGEPLDLAVQLLRLCVGEARASVILQRTERRDLTAVDYDIPSNVDLSSTDWQQKILSTKRRVASETHVAAMLNFVTNKILLEYPNLENLQDVAALAVDIASQSLSTASLSGLSIQRAKPYTASADLLRAVTVRLTAVYEKNTEASNLKSYMSKCLVISCRVLSTVASAPTLADSNSRSGVMNDGSIAVRDACYGVISILSRSKFCLVPTGSLFSRGEEIDNGEGRMPNSIDTASLLFQCAAKEEERLRPRAVAALDALLAAYCRVYTTRKFKAIETPREDLDPLTSTSNSNNPWEGMSDVSDSKYGNLTEEVSCSDSVSVDRAGLAALLIPQTWVAAQSHQPKSSRVAASRWSCELLKQLNLVRACHLLCYLAGDSDATAASIAREGLGIPKHIGDDRDMFEEAIAPGTGMTNLPDFGEFTASVFIDSNSLTRIQCFDDFSARGKAAALRFGLYCLLNDLYGGDASSILQYLGALSRTLHVFSDQANTSAGHAEGEARGSSMDLLDECCACFSSIVSASHFARVELTRASSDGSLVTLGQLENLILTLGSSRARRFLAECCGHLLEDSSLWSSGEQTADFFEWVKKTDISSTLKLCLDTLVMLEKDSLARIGRLHGSIFLGAGLIRAFRLHSSMLTTIDKESRAETVLTMIANILKLLGEGCLHSEEMIGNACADAVHTALSYNGIDAPVLESWLQKSTVSLLNCVATGLQKFGHRDTVNANRATRLARATGSCLAATSCAHTYGDPGTDNDLGQARTTCVMALFDLLGSSAYRKDEEISIVVGEALAAYADAYSPPDVVWTYQVSKDWPCEYDEMYAKQIPPHEQVIYVLLRNLLKASNPHVRGACAPAMLALTARGASRVTSSCIEARRSLVVCLKSHLGEVQSAFVSLLSFSKSSQFSRESSCFGLAACRGLLAIQGESHEGKQESDKFNQRLLQAFGQTNFGGSALMETQAQAQVRRENEGSENPSTSSNRTNETETLNETEIGGTSGLGEAALGAYREMAAASVALKRHDIFYALLFLSASHPFWSTTRARKTYSASSLLGKSIGDRMTNSHDFRSALRPHLGNLIPRILRACNDPNKQTRDQMTALWNGLTGGGAEGRLAITENLLPTIDRLIEETTIRFWRARVGACGALAQILVGRTWSELGGGGPVLNDDDLKTPGSLSAGQRLIRLWNVVVRALDDVRGAVRESGQALGRAMRALVIRLCDPSSSSSESDSDQRDFAERERDATSAAATTLRWLIRHGLNQKSEEAAGACISTLVEVVGVVKPSLLEPSLPDLIRSLLLAISGLEPAALSYLQLRTDDQEGLERIRLQMAQSGPLAEAVTKCLELVPHVGLETQHKIIPQLDAALRQSAGFATRAATADAVSLLCSTCANAFRFPGTSTSNPSVRLLRAFYFASERERGTAAKDRMTHALGNLAALCPSSSVRSLAVRACNRYRSSTGNNFDLATLRAAALTIRTIAVRASGHFVDGGKNDVWCQQVLPCAFLGKRDPDEKIAALWSEVWEEGGSVAANSSDGSPSLNNFGTSLEEKLIWALLQECLSALRDVSWARRVAGALAVVELCDKGILSPVPRSAKTGLEIDAFALDRARARSQATNVALCGCLELSIKPRLWNGKADILKAAVKLASNWVAALATSDLDAITLLGWDGQESSCPWQPLSLSDGGVSNDLFTGDNFFSMQDEIEVVFVRSEVPKADENDGNENDGKLNFEQEGVNDELEDDETEMQTTSAAAFKVPAFGGICRFLFDQAMLTSGVSFSDDILRYRVNAFQCFCDLLGSLPEDSAKQRLEVFQLVCPIVVKMIGPESLESIAEKRPKPVLMAGAIQALRVCFWKGIGCDKQKGCSTDELKELVSVLREAGGRKQPAWTVREASAQNLAHLALICDGSFIRQHAVVSNLIEVSKFALTDRKYWRVRMAGLKIIESLTNRAGNGYNTSSDTQVILDALLPQKEIMVQLVRSSLKDSEAQITALGSKISAIMAGWP